MLPIMEAKHPFSDQDWQATPEPVREYIRQLEHTIAVLVNKVKELEKRTEKLESKTNQNSQNSSKPPSSDSPFNKPNKNRKKSKCKKKPKKATKVINNNYWNRLSNKISYPKNVIAAVQQSSLTVCSPTINIKLSRCPKSKWTFYI